MHTGLCLKWKPTGSAEQGALLSVMWRPGREGSLGEKGHTCIHRNRPSTRNYHFSGNWLHSSRKRKFKKIKRNGIVRRVCVLVT